MTRFNIYSFLVVFALLFSSGLQAQQFSLDRNVEVLPLPEWRQPIGNSMTPTQKVGTQLGVPYRLGSSVLQVDNSNATQTGVTKLSKEDLGALKNGKSISSNTLAKAFSDLEVTDVGAYGLEGNEPFTASVYFSVEILLQTASGGFVGCTGTLVDPKTIVTTGSCVYNEALFGADGFVGQVIVYPGYDSRIVEENGLLEYSLALGSAAFAMEGWTNDQNMEFDLGVITLDRPIGGIIAAFEGDGETLMQYSRANDFFFQTQRFRNDGYPLGDEYQDQTQYSRQGTFDDTEAELLYVNGTSPGGMEGSPAYNPTSGDDVTAYAILSHNRDDQTGYVRFTNDKVSFVDGIISDNTPDQTDMTPQKPPTNFLPDQVDPGEVLGNADEAYFVAAHNYSTTDYTGPVFWQTFLVLDQETLADPIFLGAIGFSSTTVGAKNSVIGNASGLLTIPEDVAPGNYFIGSILVGLEDDIQENNNVILFGALEPIQIGDGVSFTLSVDPTEISVGAEAGSTTFDITSNLDWTASTDADWLTIDSESGNGNGTVTVDYEANTSTTDSRTATITIVATDGSADDVTVTITQEVLSDFLTVTPDTLRLGGEAGTASIDISSDLLWSVQESADWLEANPTSGTGDVTVDITYDANASDEERITNIDITTSGDVSATVVVIQAAGGVMEMISVDPETVTVDASAGEEDVRVSSNANWTASTDADWVTFAPSDGTGDTNITVKYDENTLIESREATITFTTESGETATVVITQSGAAGFIAVNPNAVNADSGEGDASITVTSNESWSVSTDAEWLAAIPDAGTNNGVVVLSYLENTSLDARTGIVTFTTASGASTSVTVTQSGRARVTVVDVIVNSDIHTVLEAAVIAAELADDLSGDGPFTVFAPTDAAFNLLPDGVVQTLLEDPTGDLANILLYHVLGAKVLSSDLSDGQTATTLLGEDIVVTINEEGVFINQAQVIVADIETDNGVVHVIDRVLTPPVDCNEAVDGGTVALEDGSTEARIVIDGESDILTFMSEGAMGGTFTFVVTDSDNNILGIPDGNMQDFDGAGAGVCRIWGLSYTGDLIAAIGDNAGEVDLSSECFELSSNFITVTRIDCDEVVDGGTVALEDGSTETTIIIDDEDDILTFMSEGAEGDNFTFVITDDQNNILGVPEANTANLNGAGVGVCRIWGLSYTGELTVIPGDNAGEVDLSSECFELSSNFITVTRNAPALPATVVEIIVNSDVHNTLEAAVIAAGLADDLSGEGPFTVFAPTDDAFAALPEGTVETLLEDPTGDLAQILLYHVLGGQVLSTDLMDGMTATTLQGQDITVTINDDGVFINDAQVIIADILADNGVVHVIDAVLLPELGVDCEEAVAGGTVALMGGATDTTIIVDETADVLTFMSDGAMGDNFTFVITDDVNNILAVPGGNMADLNGAGVGVCRIWGLSYTGDLIAMVGDNAGEVDLSSECFELSSNFITVTRNAPALPATVVEIIVNSDVHNTLEAAVIAAGLADDLSGEGPFTVFAPTDDAFAALPEGTVETLLEDPTGDLAQILLYHVLGGQVLSTDLMDGMTATTLQGQDITVTINDDGVFINNAQVIIADILADNGVVHVIDAVLLPELGVDCEEAVAGGTVALMGGATDTTIIVDETADVLTFMSDGAMGDNFTFVITDDVNNILAVPGGNMADLNGAGVGVCRIWGLSYTGDLIAMVGDNAGEVDLSSECFELSSNFITVTRNAPALPATVVEIIVNSDVHNTLEAAVIAAGLADDLSGEGPFTVFAPTDDAFAALPEGTVETLLEDPTGDLAQILLYHVLGGQVLSTDLMDGMTATTLQGQDITVTINDDGVFINDAQVIIADILAENGVVHVIDAVLLPPPALPATVVDIIVNSDVHNTLEAAVIAAGLADDLSGEGPFTVFAPTDDAFAALPDGVVETLLEDPTGDLAQILLYHVLSGKVLSTDLTDGLTVTTLQGQVVTITINDDGIFVNDAQVIIADLEAQNGVVHVIDAVLLPELGVDECEGVVDGGTVALEDGSTETTIIIDGEEDVLTFMSEGAVGDNFTFLVTDADNNVLGIPSGNMQEFDGAGVGVCRIWGLSYTGDLLVMSGDNAAEVDLSSECFELSSNFITVNREEEVIGDGFLDVRPDSRTVGQEAGEVVFVVYTDTDWTIDTTGLDWLTVFGIEGSGTRFIKVIYDANDGEDSRTAVLNIRATTGERGTFTLTQAGTSDFIAFENDNVDLSAVTGNESVELISNTDWTIATDADWLTVSPDAGSGNSTINISFDSNAGFEDRTATITATTGSGETATVTVTQGASEDLGDAAFLELRPDNASVDNGAGTATFVIYTNEIWRINTDADWLITYGSAGQGTAIIKVVYEANTEADSREAALEIVTSSGTSATFTLTQAGTDGLIVNPSVFDQVDVTFDLNLYPNPTAYELNIQIEASEDRRMDVQIIDMNGRVLKTYVSQAIFEGANTMQVPVSDLANGMYFFRMVGENVVKEARFIVAK